MTKEPLLLKDSRYPDGLFITRQMDVDNFKQLQQNFITDCLQGIVTHLLPLVVKQINTDKKVLKTINTQLQAAYQERKNTTGSATEKSRLTRTVSKHIQRMADTLKITFEDATYLNRAKLDCFTHNYLPKENETALDICNMLLDLYFQQCREKYYNHNVSYYQRNFYDLKWQYVPAVDELLKKLSPISKEHQKRLKDCVLNNEIDEDLSMRGRSFFDRKLFYDRDLYDLGVIINSNPDKQPANVQLEVLSYPEYLVKKAHDLKLTTDLEFYPGLTITEITNE